MIDARVMTNPTQRVPVSELQPGDRITVREDTGKWKGSHLLRRGRFIAFKPKTNCTMVLYEDDIGYERDAYVSEIIEHERQQHDQDL
jgi:hypothetical protein